MTAATAPMVIRSAGGHQLECFGNRRVDRVTAGGAKVNIEFHVVARRRAIVSVGRLTAKGYSVIFGSGGAFIQNAAGGQLPLEARRGTFVLPARVLRPSKGQGAKSQQRALGGRGGRNALVFPVGAAPGEGEGEPEQEDLDPEVFLDGPAGGAGAAPGAAGTSDPVPPAPAAGPSVPPALPQPPGVAPKPRLLPEPPLPPSAAEVERHSATHVPRAPWCAICRAARGRDDPHRRVAAGRREDQEENLTEAQIDYTFAVEGGKAITILTARLVLSPGGRRRWLCPSRGRSTTPPSGSRPEPRPGGRGGLEQRQLGGESPGGLPPEHRGRGAAPSGAPRGHSRTAGGA